MLIFSIIELGVGGAVYNYLDSTYVCGVFWVSILTFAAAACAIVSENRDWIISTCVLASVSIPVTVTGLLIESGTLQHLSGISACRGYDGERYYNGPRYDRELQYCSALKPPGINDCYCGHKLEDDCTDIILKPIDASTKMTCGNIFTTYTGTLKASIGFCCLIIIFSFVISVMSCTILCCPTQLAPNQLEPKAEPFEEYTIGVTRSSARSVLNSDNEHLHAANQPNEHLHASYTDQPAEHTYAETGAKI